MGCSCSEKCAKWTTIILAVVTLVLGIALAVAWGKLYFYIVGKQLGVSNTHTQGYKNWHETPIPMYLEIHLFNWTNPQTVQKYPGVKPSFVEMGPYMFWEHHIKENITFNDNDTITFLNKRIWQFRPELSNGSLDDKVTFLNPIAIVVANLIRNEHYLVKRAVNFFLEEKGEELSVTKEVREVLFDGYDDPLIDIAEKLNISGMDLPFKTFGWFVDRNGSAIYDGVYNMYDGGKDFSRLGVIANWNYQHNTSYYPGKCGVVSGTTGELWYPPHEDDQIEIFSSDLCSGVKLSLNGTESLYGLEGNLWRGKADVFDNGTNYESGKCFASGMRTGVRDVSTCKFGVPAYMSFPHFYLADPMYRQAVDGMSPNPEIHSARVSLEPNTGLPLRVYAAFQLNMIMRNVTGIDMLAHVKETLIPCFWFVQKAELTEDLASLTKTLLIFGKVGTYTGYGLVGIGVLLFCTYGYLTYRGSWSGWRNKEEQLLNQENNVG